MAVGDDIYGDVVDDNNASGYNRGQQGVFGLHPLATPKYALNKGNRDNEFKETLARMYVSLADADESTKDLYLKALPGDGPTQALAKVLIGKGQGQGGTGFIDFFLQQVNESFQEAVQVDKVLGDNYVAFYFGQEPPIFQYAGALLNSMQDDQRSGFALAYQHLLRGTSLARRGALLRLRYDSVIVSGTVNTMSQTLNAENEMVVPFNFSLLVKEYIVLQNPRFNKTTQAEYVQLATQFAEEGLSLVGQVSDIRIRTVLYQPTPQDAALAASNKLIADAFALQEAGKFADVRGTVTTPTAAQVSPLASTQDFFNP